MTTGRKITLPSERKLRWIGTSNDDLRMFPVAVQREILIALEVARLGGKHASAKPWRGEANVFEIAVADGDAYRTLYWARFKEAVYVLHSFQKKSTQGIKTPKREADKVAQRLRAAKADYEVRYGAGKTKGH